MGSTEYINELQILLSHYLCTSGFEFIVFGNTIIYYLKEITKNAGDLIINNINTYNLSHRINFGKYLKRL